MGGAERVGGLGHVGVGDDGGAVAFAERADEVGARGGGGLERVFAHGDDGAEHDDEVDVGAALAERLDGEVALHRLAVERDRPLAVGAERDGLAVLVEEAREEREVAGRRLADVDRVEPEVGRPGLSAALRGGGADAEGERDEHGGREAGCPHHRGDGRTGHRRLPKGGAALSRAP